MKVIRNAAATNVRQIAGAAIAGAALTLVLVAGAMSLAPAASAQAPPLEPLPSETCTATLTLNPSTIAFTGDRAVQLSISGFEPGALYSVFVGSRFFGGGIISSDGTGATSILIDALVAATPQVQVATTKQCAVATLTIVGPLRVGCEPIVVDGFVSVCPIERD